jgi:putative transcriptional regulator
MGIVSFALDPRDLPRPDGQQPIGEPSDAAITEAARQDPDNPPLTEEELERVALARWIKAVRTPLGLSQEAFAARYGIPVATLRQWEMGRRQPDRATLSYLRVIATMPAEVAAALTAA